MRRWCKEKVKRIKPKEVRELDRDFRSPKYRARVVPNKKRESLNRWTKKHLDHPPE